MDFNRLLARVRGILLQPRLEWPRIAEETDTTAGLYTRYILILAAVPPVLQFIKSSLIGYHVLGVYVHDSFFGGLWHMVLRYLITLVVVYVSAQIVNALAPTFGGRKDSLQALKAVAYAWTASWVAGIGILLPWISLLIMLAGLAYAIYLLYLGLPQTMHCPPEKSAGYTAVSVLLTLLLSWLLALVLGLSAGFGSMAFRTHHQVASKAKADVAAAVAELAQAGKHADDQASGSTSDAADKPAAHLHALSPEHMRAMLPAELDGFTRKSATASRQTVTGMQLSQAKATYQDGKGHDIDLTIVDAAGARALLAMGTGLTGDAESITDDGFDKIHHDGDRVIHETWNGKQQHGEYNVMLGNRFSVRASGNVSDFDVLKKAVGQVDLDGLEKLKDADGDQP